VDTLIGHRMLRGARIGLIAGLGLAALFLMLGIWGNELNKVVGYLLLLVGFPVVFAILPALQWLGIQGGLGEFVPLVLLSLSLNGSLWGALLGAIPTSQRPRDRPGG
jgi:hypothetical protein